MSRIFSQFLLVSPAAFVVSGLLASGAIAGETAPQTIPVQASPQLTVPQVQPLKSAPSVSQLEADPLSGAPAPTANPSKSMAQVTSVSQLSDVQPTDWAFQAVQSLVEKYGCIVGYPDSTFRGNRAATRYELAAALNACLDVISDRFATKEDLQAVRKLMEEFAAELATLRGRIDGLEARTAELEAIQFSTTTKLRGVAVVSFSDSLTGNNVITGDSIDDNPIVSYRVRLNLDTSFTGKDLLRTRLQAGNVPNYGDGAITGTNMSRLAYDVPGNPGDTANIVSLDKLFYRFPIFEKGTLQVDALRMEFNDNVYNFNPLFESGDRGAVSRFGRFNPIYRVGGDAGVTFNYPLLQKDKKNVLTFSAAYSGGATQTPGQVCDSEASTGNASCFSAANPIANFPGGSGLFSGPYAALAQLEFQPIKDLRLGLTYVRSFGLDPSGSVGSRLAANPFGSGALSSFRNVSADNFGFQFTYKLIPQFTVSGWAGYSSVDGVQGTVDGRNASLINWGLTLGAPDLWRKGDLAGLIVGTPPTVIGNSAGNIRTDATLPFLVEAQYRFAVTDNISVTPAVITIINPLNSIGGSEDAIVLGVVRTTFTF
ncbi:MAG: iron uptake porin [Aphanocapsa sp. GSE-SYN-MK-11-07L]|nr:iron uptake porin [Aphanocapsa sp. GSE-SYN-MK-11-07L]